jgi:hypothetical protein
MESFDFLSTPNCDECLLPMSPVVSGWWCCACNRSFTVDEWAARGPETSLLRIDRRAVGSSLDPEPSA